MALDSCGNPSWYTYVHLEGLVPILFRKPLISTSLGGQIKILNPTRTSPGPKRTAGERPTPKTTPGNPLRSTSLHRDRASDSARPARAARGQRRGCPSRWPQRSAGGFGRVGWLMQMEQVHRDVRNKGITSNKVRYETGLRQHRDRLVRSDRT